MPLIQINSKLEPFLTKQKKIKIAIGGRGAGKSIGFGDIFTMKMCTEGADIYCLREFQDSVKDSVHRVFIDSIKKRLQIPGFEIYDQKIVAPNGAQTTYKGAARNPDSLQSAQGYKYSWFEEAHRASQASIDKLLPTIIRNPGAECWFSANPQSSADPFSQRFIVPYQSELDKHGYYEDDLHLIIVVNWRDNPWWNEEQEILRAWDYDNLSRSKYNWIWEGSFNDEVDNAIIKQEWFDAAIDAHKIERLKEAFKPHGAIVAAHDPSDEGKDPKGYSLRHGSIFLKILEKPDGEIDEGCEWATDMAIADGANWFIWDGDGMGAGLKRQISTAFQGTGVQYHMFKGSLSGKGQDNAGAIYMPVADANPNDKPATYAETFLNNRAQYSIQLRDRYYNTFRCVVRGEYVSPADMISIDSNGVEEMQKLRTEVCGVPKKPNNTGLIQIMSKQEMAKLGIKSPNMYDSQMMNLYQPAVKQARREITYPKIGIV